MKDSIILICLDSEFACKVAQYVCSLTGKFYLDSEQLMEYQIPNKDEIVENCGYDYFKKQEIKFLKGLSDYEDTVIMVKYETFAVDENYLLFEKLPCCYLYFSKKDIKLNFIEKIAYKDRHNLLEQFCKYKIDCKKKEIASVAEEILKLLK